MTLQQSNEFTQRSARSEALVNTYSIEKLLGQYKICVRIAIPIKQTKNFGRLNMISSDNGLFLVIIHCFRKKRNRPTRNLLSLDIVEPGLTTLSLIANDVCQSMIVDHSFPHTWTQGTSLFAFWPPPVYDSSSTKTHPCAAILKW